MKKFGKGFLRQQGHQLRRVPRTVAWRIRVGNRISGLDPLIRVGERIGGLVKVGDRVGRLGCRVRVELRLLRGGVGGQTGPTGERALPLRREVVIPAAT